MWPYVHGLRSVYVNQDPCTCVGASEPVRASFTVHLITLVSSQPNLSLLYTPILVRFSKLTSFRKFLNPNLNTKHYKAKFKPPIKPFSPLHAIPARCSMHHQTRDISLMVSSNILAQTWPPNTVKTHFEVSGVGWSLLTLHGELWSWPVIPSFMISLPNPPREVTGCCVWVR